MQADVCLVNMPYSSITTPSLALGLLETYISDFGHHVETIHANMEFANTVGLAEYETINHSFHECLLGEWTFSSVAFPEKTPNDDAFFALFADITPEEKKHLISVRELTAAFIENMANDIIAKQPKIVGCTSTFQQNCASLALLRKIKAINPNIITMMGGANCEGDMGQQISDSFAWVDYVFSGECDDVIGEFTDKLLKGQTIEPHKLPPGFIVQKNNLLTSQETKDKKVHIAAINDMSKISAPIYDTYFASLERLDLYKYISPGLIVETSRGCWWGAKQHCTFCGLFGSSMTYRSKAPEVILNELESLSNKYQVTKFEMVDNIIPLEYSDTVIPALAEKQAYTFFYETKSNLKKEHIQQLSKAGIKFIQPGIESLHDDFLKLVKKGVTAIQNVALLKWSRTFGVRVLWNLLADAPKDKDKWYSEMAELVPNLTHLEPPCSELIKIRYPRFSPYFNKPEEFGLTLEPLKTYKHIYPLAQAELAKIAYFFDQQTTNELGNYNVTQSFKFKTTGLMSLQKLIVNWREIWANNQRPIFCMLDKGNKIILTDTRPIATNLLHTLEGRDAEIYRLCAEPITPERLFKKISMEDSAITREIFDTHINKLLANHLLLSLSKCLLSLAYSQDAEKELSLKDYPSGYLDIEKILSDRDSIKSDEPAKTQPIT